VNSGADPGGNWMLAVDLPPNQHQDQQNNQHDEQNEEDDTA